MHDYVKPEPTHLQYDADGNLIEDAEWHYTYDGENRMVAQETSDIAVTAGAPHERIEHVYDNMGRCINTKVYHWQTVAGASVRNPDPAMNVNYLYNEWSLIAELDANNGNAVLRSYAWGLDMSGSSGGAGGIGGLLMADLRVPTGGGNFTTNRVLYGYDGNGNVITLAAANTGNLVASYDYDPFGNTIKIDGSLATYNCFRFSTKWLETDAVVGGRDLGLYNYGRRHLSLDLLRFLNHDPIEESGGMNLYAFCLNDGIDQIDGTGLVTYNLSNSTEVNMPSDQIKSDYNGGFDFTGSVQNLVNDTPLAARLLAHYLGRSGSTYYLTPDDVMMVDAIPNVDVYRHRGFTEKLNEADNNGKCVFTIKEEDEAFGEYRNGRKGGNNSLGKFLIRIKGIGELISQNPKIWRFIGELRFEDRYDGDNPADSTRSGGGGFKTAVLGALPGVPFYERSDWMSLQQDIYPVGKSIWIGAK